MDIPRCSNSWCVATARSRSVARSAILLVPTAQDTECLAFDTPKHHSRRRQHHLRTRPDLARRRQGSRYSRSDPRCWSAARSGSELPSDMKRVGLRGALALAWEHSAAAQLATLELGRAKTGPGGRYAKIGATSHSTSCAARTIGTRSQLRSTAAVFDLDLLVLDHRLDEVADRPRRAPLPSSTAGGGCACWEGACKVGVVGETDPTHSLVMMSCPRGPEEVPENDLRA